MEWKATTIIGRPVFQIAMQACIDLDISCRWRVKVTCSRTVLALSADQRLWQREARRSGSWRSHRSFVCLRTPIRMEGGRM